MNGTPQVIRASASRRNAAPENKAPVEKNFIYPHRSYRKLTEASRFSILFQFIVLTAPFMAAIYLLFPYITYLNCYNAYYLLSSVIPPEYIRILQTEYLGQDLYLLSLPGSFPTLEFSFGAALVSFLVLLLLPNLGFIPRAIGVYLALVAFINLASAIFFVYVPDLFPYSTLTFSILYHKTNVSMLFMVPPIVAVSILPLPTGIWNKIGLIFLILLFNIFLNFLRYAAFLYILSKFSFIFMAVLFLSFGPLLDFIYAVVMYSIFITGVSKKIKKDMQLWKWSY